MNQLLHNIDEAQRELDEVDDQLAVAIETVEQALHDRVSSRISIDITDDPQVTCLSFGKLSGNWRLIAGLGEKETPLVSASREVRARVLAGGHLERLIRETADTLRTQTLSRKAATEAANRALHLLKGS